MRSGLFIRGSNKQQFTFNCIVVAVVFLATDAFIRFSHELYKSLLIEVHALCY